MTIADTQPPTPSVSNAPAYISAWEAADFLGLSPYDVLTLCRCGVITAAEWNGVVRVEVASMYLYADRLPHIDKDKTL